MFTMTIKCILETLVILCFFKIDPSLAQETLCTLRSPFGDVVYSVSDGVHCGDVNLTEVDLQACPGEAPTFLPERTCCVEDQNGCNLTFAGEGTNVTASSAIPGVFITGSIGHLKTIEEMSCGTQEFAKLFDRRSSEIVTDCSVKTFELEGNVILETNGTVWVNLTDLTTAASGTHRISLQCNNTSGRPSEQCLMFKLITSQSQAVCNFKGLDLNRIDLRQCESVTSLGVFTTSYTTDEKPTSIWEKYNRVLVYVVVGAGCALGLILILIIIICLLAGCVLNNKRRKERVHHKLQLESIINLNLPCTYNQETIDSDSLTAQIPTRSRPTPLLVKVEAPAVPQAELKIDEQVTFDSFKGSSPKKIELEVASITEPNRLASVKPDVHYEMILPLWKVKATQDPAETYDTLVHKGVLTSGKDLTPKSSADSRNQYSHLNNASSLATRDNNDSGDCFSLQASRGSRNNSATPPPLQPRLDCYDLEEFINPLRRDIFESSWSHANTIDRKKTTSFNTENIYNLPTSPSPTALPNLPTSHSPKALPYLPRSITPKALQQAMGINVDDYEIFEEPIYDFPPLESPDLSSLDSYVDMEGLTLKFSVNKNKLI